MTVKRRSNISTRKGAGMFVSIRPMPVTRRSAIAPIASACRVVWPGCFAGTDFGGAYPGVRVAGPFHCRDRRASERDRQSAGAREEPRIGLQPVRVAPRGQPPVADNDIGAGALPFE